MKSTHCYPMDTNVAGPPRQELCTVHIKGNGFLRFLQKNHSNAKKLFVCKKRDLTAETFKDLFTIGFSIPMVKKSVISLFNVLLFS